MMSPLDQAKDIAARGLSFRICERRRVFPPRDIANAFFACGRDDLIGEELLEWKPFSLSEGEYVALFEWWRNTHPATRIDRLGATDSDFVSWFGRAAASGRGSTLIRACFLLLILLGLAIFAYPVVWTPTIEFASIDGILGPEGARDPEDVAIVRRTWQFRSRQQNIHDWFSVTAGVAVALAATVAWYKYEHGGTNA